jgi:hypothetical protein
MEASDIIIGILKRCDGNNGEKYPGEDNPVHIY